MEEQLSAIEIERDEAINDLEQLRNNMRWSEPKPDPISQSLAVSPSSELLPSYSESDLEFLPEERARIMLEQMRSKKLLLAIRVLNRCQPVCRRLNTGILFNFCAHLMNWLE